MQNQHALMVEKLANIVTAIPFNRLLGLKLNHISAEHIELRFAMQQELIGNFLQGILHGGVISSVLDMAGGLAAMSGAIKKHPHHTEEELVEIVGKCSTIDLQINYLRPGRGELFSAKAWLIKQGKQLSFCRMELSNEENTLIAMGTATYLLKIKNSF